MLRSANPYESSMYEGNVNDGMLDRCLEQGTYMDAEYIAISKDAVHVTEPGTSGSFPWCIR